jgi:MHS family proline/betaine transporter-like MFS transporter
MTPLSKKSFFGAALGTMVEYYDYALFTIFMPIFSPLFFPAQSAYESLVKGYFVLLIAMIARPLGGLAFGYLGDAFGRRKALLTSMYGIALATTAIGLIPSSSTIGVWATVLIILAKALQIFCFGGEFNGAGIYVTEHAQNKREIWISSLLTATTLFGSLLASLVGVLATASFMPAASWRVAFVLGGLIGAFGILYRKNMVESPDFEEADLKRQSLKVMLKTYPQELIAGIFMGGFATVPATTVLTFINPVLMTQGYFTNHELMLVQTFLIFCAVLALLGVGQVADRSHPAKIMAFAAWSLVLLSYPLLLAVDSKNFLVLLSALTTLIVINEIFLSPSHAYFKSIFPMQYRYRASSLSFCLGMSLLGGLTPIIENYLYKLTGQFSAVSIWLMIVGLGTLWSLSQVKKKQAAAAPPQTIATAPLASLS